MCTSLCVSLKNTGKGILFGRSMDIESHFGEQIVIKPRAYPFRFRCLPDLETHYAIIGTAVVAEGYPLYADAMNEKGVCMAGLHFPGNAVYVSPCGFARDDKRIAPFELIPYLLGTAWLAFSAGMTFSEALAAGVIPFIVEDLIKMVLAALVAPQIYTSLKKANLAD